MKINAPASCGPTLEMALLIADPTPELRTGTDVMSAVVSGATIIMMPSPKMIEPGRKSTRYEMVGGYGAGAPGLNRQAPLLAGTRGNHRTPRAITAGPAAMNHPGPYFPARLPNRPEQKIRKSGPGVPPPPSAAAG